jgi:hypothetical protein
MGFFFFSNTTRDRQLIATEASMERERQRQEHNTISKKKEPRTKHARNRAGKDTGSEPRWALPVG